MAGDNKENGGSSESRDEDEQVFKLVTAVVQWFLVLEQVSADRADESYWQTSNAKCQCSKAEELAGKCRELKKEMDEIVQVDINLDRSKVETELVLDQVSSRVKELGAALRADISIQIPLNIDGSPTELSKRASRLVIDGNVRHIVLEALEGVVKYINELFNVDTCKHEKPQTTKADLLSTQSIVESFGKRGQIRKAVDDGNEKVPKRFRAGRKSMDEEEGFRPFKAPPPAEVLNLLEKKKKLVKKNGLHQFVLWREAYRGERERASDIETRSARKFMAMAKRRKRSPFGLRQKF